MENSIDLFKAGVFAKIYGKEYFVSVNDSSAIDRVRWSFVKKSSKGKDSMDFYMPMDAMVTLTADVMSGAFEKKISEDTSQYANTYVFNTGEMEKRLSIGKGRSGVLIECRYLNENKKRSVAVSFQACKELAFNFRLASGLIPVMGNTYYGNLLKAFNDARDEREKKFPQKELTGSDAASAPVISDEPAEAEPEQAETQFYVAMKGNFTEKGKFFIVDGTLNGESVSVYFKKDVEQEKWFTPFKKAVTGNKGATAMINGEKKGTNILFDSFVAA